MDFTGKSILVTGGSRGIGRAVAVAFATHGGRVAVGYRAHRDPHTVVQSDVTDPASVERMDEAAVSALDGLDIVVNNAGIWVAHAPDTTGYGEWREAWRKTLDTDLIGPANVCYCAARYFIERGGGRLVNISSRGAFRGEPEAPAYAASKAGLNAMSQSLALRLAPFGVFVGVVAPGFVDTERVAWKLDGPDGDAVRAQSPLGRVARPEEVAHAVLFLASDGAEFTTGTIIDVNGASYLRS
ncbi:MAG: SDR family NAD(P)-dependent oxidoreductase [Acidobacteriota bacterium]